MKPLTRDERFGVVTFLVVVLAVLFRMATPASLWFSVYKLEVSDARCWQDLTVDLDRVIHRDFQGSWVGKVRRKAAQGFVTHATTPLSELPYQTDSKLPEPVTLEWLLWTEPRAYQLPPGEYDGVVTWAVWPHSLIWRREITRNFHFIIWGGDECTK